MNRQDKEEISRSSRDYRRPRKTSRLLYHDISEWHPEYIGRAPRCVDRCPMQCRTCFPLSLWTFAFRLCALENGNVDVVPTPLSRGHNGSRLLAERSFSIIYILVDWISTFTSRCHQRTLCGAPRCTLDEFCSPHQRVAANIKRATSLLGDDHVHRHPNQELPITTLSQCLWVNGEKKGARCR